MARLLRGEQRGLRGLRKLAGLLGLGLLAGDALTVNGGFGEQIESVWRKTKLVLRDGQMAAVAFHGEKRKGVRCWPVWLAPPRCGHAVASVACAFAPRRTRAG